MGSFSYTSHAGVSLTQYPYVDWLDFVFYVGSFSYTSRSGEFRGVSLTIPCWLHIWGYISYAGFIFMQRVSLCTSHTGLFCYLGSFSYTSRAGFFFIKGVSLTHPMLDLFLCGEILLYIPCCLQFWVGSSSHTFRAAFIIMRDVSLTHPKLHSFLCGKVLLQSRAGLF